MSKQFKIHDSSDLVADQEEAPHMQTMNDGGDIQLIEMEMFSQHERDRYDLDEEDEDRDGANKTLGLEDSQRIRLVPQLHNMYETDDFEPKPVALQIKSVLQPKVQKKVLPPKKASSLRPISGKRRPSQPRVVEQRLPPQMSFMDRQSMKNMIFADFNGSGESLQSKFQLSNQTKAQTISVQSTTSKGESALSIRNLTKLLPNSVKRAFNKFSAKYGVRQEEEEALAESNDQEEEKEPTLSSLGQNSSSSKLGSISSTLLSGSAMAAENSMGDNQSKGGDTSMGGVSASSQLYVEKERGLTKKYTRKRPQDTYTLTSTLNDQISREERSLKKAKPWSHSIETIEAKLKGSTQTTTPTAAMKNQIDDSGVDLEARSLDGKGSSLAVDSDDSDLCDVDLDEVLNNRLKIGKGKH